MIDFGDKVRSTSQVRKSNGSYALSSDFCQLFEEQMSRFYFLSLLITGDKHKAENCFVESLERCLQSKGVFREFIQRWAVHTILKTGIEMAYEVATEEMAVGNLTRNDVLVSLLGGLPPLDRLAFVMTVLEKYSNRESAAYLACSGKDVKAARERALSRIGSDATFEAMLIGAGSFLTGQVRATRACA